jgi:hypothetical protein
VTCICHRAAPKCILPRYTELVKKYYTCLVLLLFVPRDQIVALSEFEHKRMTVTQCDFLDSVLVFVSVARVRKSRTKSASLVSKGKRLNYNVFTEITCHVRVFFCDPVTAVCPSYL